MRETALFGLPQWDAVDPILRKDFNRLGTVLEEKLTNDLCYSETRKDVSALELGVGERVKIDGYSFTKLCDSYPSASTSACLFLCHTGLAATAWSITSSIYAGGTLDAYLTDTYFPKLPASIREAAESAALKVCAGAHINSAVTTIQRKIFALAIGDLRQGFSLDGIYISHLRALVAGTRWTRTPGAQDANAWRLSDSGGDQVAKGTAITPAACILLPRNFIVKTVANTSAITTQAGNMIQIPTGQLEYIPAKIANTSYIGNGTSGSNSPNLLYVPFRPRIAIVASSTEMGIMLVNTSTGFVFFTGGNYGNEVTTVNGVSCNNSILQWYSSGTQFQLNQLSTGYNVCLIG